MQYEGPSQKSFEEMQPVVPQSDAADLFRGAVETARLGIQQSLAGSEKVGEAVKPKLTIDLSHRFLEGIPDEVVEILKRDVER